MTKKKECDVKVPLFLIAPAIAGGVKKRGGKRYRVSVVRTAEHQYQIKYTCQAVHANHTRAPLNISPFTREHPSKDEVEDHA